MSSFGLENVAKLVRIMQDNENLGALATQVSLGEEQYAESIRVYF